MQAYKSQQYRFAVHVIECRGNGLMHTASTGPLDFPHMALPLAPAQVAERAHAGAEEERGARLGVRPHRLLPKDLRLLVLHPVGDGVVWVGVHGACEQGEKERRGEGSSR